MMNQPDLNLLFSLEALLEEQSVAGAARRMGRSASAMSRALARLREVMGDPLLVRAGGRLVPTPRALELRDEVAPLLRRARGVLRPVECSDLSGLERTFTLRTSEGFMTTFGPPLLALMSASAPNVCLRFEVKTGTPHEGLRTGTLDLETGVVRASTTPELRSKLLYRDRFIAALRTGHALPLDALELGDYARASHVGVARHLRASGPIDGALEALGFTRTMRFIVDSFAAALSLAQHTDLVATVPLSQTLPFGDRVRWASLPFETPEILVSMLWHPRMDADLEHLWLRQCLAEVTASAGVDVA